MGSGNLFESAPTGVIANMGFQYGQQLVSRNLGGFFAIFSALNLKYYFHVSNRYVMNKIKVLILPCTNKHWSRQAAEPPVAAATAPGAQRAAAFLPPSEDVMAPDLYLPTMAFVTFVLLVGASLGTVDKFNPEALGVTASTSLILLLLEVLLIKFACYLIDTVSSPSWLDLLAYAGYKYVNVAIQMLAGLMFGTSAFYVSYCFFTSCFALFIIRTLNRALGHVSSADHFPGSPMSDASAAAAVASVSSSKRNYVLLAVGLLQFPLSYYLARPAAMVWAGYSATPVLIPPTAAVTSVAAGAGAVVAAATEAAVEVATAAAVAASS